MKLTQRPREPNSLWSAGATGSQSGLNNASGSVDSLTNRIAVYGPVRTVVWEGRSREAPPYPDYWALELYIRASFRWPSEASGKITAGGRRATMGI